MAWFRLDDKFHSHHKVLCAGNAAVGLYVRLGTYSVHYDFGGLVPIACVKGLGKPREFRALIDVGMIEPVDQFYYRLLVGEADRPVRRKISECVRRSVYERDGHRCRQCGAVDGLSIDHIFPWSLGGSDDETNLQTLCLPCNVRKGASV